jgi:hypothetical protein
VIGRAPPRAPRVLGLVAGLAGVIVLAAGCVRGSVAPSVANLGTTSTPASRTSSSGGANVEDSGATGGGPAVALAACIRSHGDPTLPPSTPGHPFDTSVDPTSPKFQAAMRTCAKLMPQNAPPDMVPHKVGPLVAFAKCMRKHGVTNYPDPDSQGHFPASERQINTYTPVFQTAIRTCRPLADGEPL